jgi:hypothetical protein
MQQTAAAVLNREWTSLCEVKHVRAQHYVPATVPGRSPASNSRCSRQQQLCSAEVLGQGPRNCGCVPVTERGRSPAGRNGCSKDQRLCSIENQVKFLGVAHEIPAAEQGTSSAKKKWAQPAINTRCSC